MLFRSAAFLFSALLPIASTYGAPIVDAVPSAQHPDSSSDDSDLSPRDQQVEPIIMIDPRYPRKALVDCLSGWVEMEFWVNEEGRVEDVRITRQDSSRLFGRSAVAAMQKWRFKPRIVDGEPVGRLTTLPLRFARPDGCDGKSPEASPDSVRGWLIVPVQLAESVGEIDIVLLPVLSELIGSPDSRLLDSGTVSSGDKVSFFVHDVTDTLVDRLNNRNAIDGVTVTPEETQFARIAVLAQPRSDDDQKLDSYLTDAKSRDLVLVYVDRKASFSGEQKVGSTPLHYRLEFPGPGLYWAEMRITADQTAYEVVRLEEDPEPVLVVESLNQ